MVAAITSIIGPNKINDLMNVIESGIQSIDGISMPDFLKICYFLISIYILGAIVNYCQQFIMADVTQKLPNVYEVISIKKLINCL